MGTTTWVKQTDQPAFADLLWSQPQNRASAGKLLIVGGSLHSFNTLSQAYSAALKAGIGAVRVVAPSSLAKLLSKVFPEAQFAPSTDGGNFASSALAEIIDNAAWADGLLLAGDFGSNSQTSVMLEKLLTKYKGPAVLAADTADYLDHKVLLNRPRTTIVTDFARLQRLAAQSGVTIQQLSDLMQLTTKLADWSRATALATAFQDFVVVSADKVVSTTPGSVNLVELAAYSAVWQIQQPAKAFEALTTAVFSLVAI
jgi:NAD(P)H-hydrate repair Nnr-like enzyme with NAD(P)H-hydrate dehydratase domain